MTEPSPARYGWSSDLPAFYGTQPRVVRLRLESCITDASPEQIRAWDESIPWLQRECREVVRGYDPARDYTAILEYELPLESRRPDVIVLENGVVVVLELKGKIEPSQADLDQVSAYARDLKAYHAECADRPVVPVLVPTRAGENVREVDRVRVVGPAGVHRLLFECTRESASPLTAEAFLRHDAYAPLPSLVRAARDLFQKKDLPRIKRARAATDPAVARITSIAHEAHATGSRRLILLTGVPGSGKTLVGLRLVHAGFLDDLAVERSGRKPSAPAVFLSGNDPLVDVLQDALKDAGGGGKVFVRRVRDYRKTYTRRSNAVPPEHLLVFDEAQRAWDPDQVRRKNRDSRDVSNDRSEPEQFIEIASRIPGWAVVVGLVGTGQEIHAGEEGGLVQWRRAIESSGAADSWTVHAPPSLRSVFEGGATRTSWEDPLSLDVEIRNHLAPKLSVFVKTILEDNDVTGAARLAEELFEGGIRLLMTRSLDTAERYARDRYENALEARYGLLASSKDKLLPSFGIDNTFQTTKRLRVGRWYNAPQDEPESCCRLDTAATEFAAQGLELDLAILAWGSDLLRMGGRWSIERGGKTRFARNPEELRRNVYRVLLTRGRDGTVIFVPPAAEFDETAAYLEAAGIRRLQGQ